MTTRRRIDWTAVTLLIGYGYMITRAFLWIVGIDL